VARVIIALVLISRHAGFLDDSDFSFEIYGALFKIYDAGVSIVGMLFENPR
jgi:hypothetical protein